MTRLSRCFCGTAWFVALIAFCGPVLAADVDYVRDVKPLLKEKCGACHGPLAQKAGLRLDAGELVRKGGDGGPIVDLENSDESELLYRVTAEDDAERMPPASEGERLTPSEVAILRGWTLSGAKSPADEEILADPRDHWAYQVPKRSEIPATTTAEWLANPIDAFIARKHAEKGLTPVALANKPTLLRRVFLDLIGLPPTPAELHAFLADESPNAYENVVDRLLDSPRYGERWGRHCMDVWRYSDWFGFGDEVRGSQRNIWRWRDWIIESLNADKGYDQMIVEMLAGDEIAPENPDVLRATGFLARNYTAQGNKPNRDMWLDNAVEHTAKGFLGITLNCAKCHDHKYDPISQKDYYHFRAIFEPYDVRADRVPGRPDVLLDGIARVFDGQLEAPTYLYIRGNEKQPDKERPLSPAVPPNLAGADFLPEPVDLPLPARIPALQEFIEREDIAAAEFQARKSTDEAERLQLSGAAEPEQRLAALKSQADRLKLDALRARWAADKLRYSSSVPGKPDPAQARQTAQLERAANLAVAEQAVLEKEIARNIAAAAAEQSKDDSGKKTRLERAEKALETARTQLAAAQANLEKTDGEYSPVGKVYPERSTGRRLALARWIASRDNPLTARVAVNQMWLRHFGTPLVENVFDFGLNSPRPELADLLDWLAFEFMEPSQQRDGFSPFPPGGGRAGDGGDKLPRTPHFTPTPDPSPVEGEGRRQRVDTNDLRGEDEAGAWRLKPLHRLMVTSQTYRLSSNGDACDANRTIDPTSRFYWKWNARRLEAEAVRDSILAAAGSLDVRMGGPDIDFKEGEAVPRRSIYFRTAYQKQMRLMALFDGPGPSECYRRSTSIVPQQALSLANGQLTLTQSRILARSLWVGLQGQSDPQRAFVCGLFERILTRVPAPAEERVCLDFLNDQSQRLARTGQLTPITGGDMPQLPPADDPAARARENLAHALLNHNDFVTVR